MKKSGKICCLFQRVKDIKKKNTQPKIENDSIVDTEYVLEFKKIEDVLAEENKQREDLKGIGEVTKGSFKGSEVVCLNKRTFILDSKTNLLLECNGKNLNDKEYINQNQARTACVGMLCFKNGDNCDITVVFDCKSDIVDDWADEAGITPMLLRKYKAHYCKTNRTLTETEEKECNRIAEKYLCKESDKSIDEYLEDFENGCEYMSEETRTKCAERIVEKIVEKYETEHPNQDEERSE